MKNQVSLLLNLNLVAKALSRRGLKVRPNGRVWSDELEAFVSSAEALLAGLGKARRTKAEREVFDLLLLNVAGAQAVKAAKKQAEVAYDVDKERELDHVVELQEVMARGMVLIERTNKVIEVRWEKNPFAGYVHKAWKTPVEERTEKQVRSMSWGENKELAQWFEYRSQLWDRWNLLQEISGRMARENNLWGAFFALQKTAFMSNSGGLGRCPDMRDDNIFVPTPAQEEEEASCEGPILEGDQVEQFDKEGVAEQAAFLAAWDQGEYHRAKARSSMARKSLPHPTPSPSTEEEWESLLGLAEKEEQVSR